MQQVLVNNCVLCWKCNEFIRVSRDKGIYTYLICGHRVRKHEKNKQAMLNKFEGNI